MDDNEPFIRSHRMCCAKIVRNVRLNLMREKTARQHCFATTRVSDRLKYFTGLSSSTIQHLVHGDNVASERHLETRNRSVLMDAEDEYKIRPVIIDMVRAKLTPTLDNITLKLQEENATWEWSRSSLHKAMGRIGFKYNTKRQNYYDRLREDEKNIALRIKYLANYIEYELAGRPMVFMDESWINKNCRPSKCWHDGTGDTVEKVPPGKGPRWILIGAGTKDGWVPNSFRMWKGNVASEDYHSEMNSSVFYDWVHNYLLPNVAPNSVIVIDRATYHLALTEDSVGAAQTWKKQKLLDWILENGIVNADGILYTQEALERLKKPDLWVICHDNKPVKKYKIHEWMKTWNGNHGTDIKVNILPIAHPQLNPIEMLWGWIKRDVAANNHDFSMVTIERLTRAKVAALDGAWWAKACAKSDRFAVNSIEADDVQFEGEEEAGSDDELVENGENSEED